MNMFNSYKKNKKSSPILTFHKNSILLFNMLHFEKTKIIKN